MPGAAGNLADHIRDSVLNVSFPGRYAYATPTNVSGGGNMSVLFYNVKKLSFISVKTLVATVTDFNLYKFRYNDPNLGITHDTTFLYVVVNHTQSGSSSITRDSQVSQEMSALRAMFPRFPNLINMGDFNTANRQQLTRGQYLGTTHGIAGLVHVLRQISGNSKTPGSV